MSDARKINKEFVHQALRKVGLGASDQHKDYAARRLDEGAIKYGEDQYLEADCAAEAAEEGIDGANWAAFEWVKRWQADDLDESCQNLELMAQHFALAYEYGRRYLDGRPEASQNKP